jgi:hypothetical protein
MCDYTVRLYGPRAEILNGKWKFPDYYKAPGQPFNVRPWHVACFGHCNITAVVEGKAAAARTSQNRRD